ncbi:hypothetical protein K435DRAFT_868264 [Dendrothele bispora CBS 962.96]|uniref:Uncharacterized protein n=2 Tax=Dendrothele bispora (strain CBS 962.96) TaxID=1314807 RepID=A0A4S8LCX5_DENBC|nr:hypothetical protein K435DRAFT_868264 [Dendrothele bispora CBS 962.96]
MSEQPQAVRITSVDVYHKPELLLHSAQPDAPLTAFDGRVGAVIADTGYFVTSPNMNLVYSPRFTPCLTRMRRDYHFGTDDPMYFPQPFNMTVGHLAIIPAPSPDSFHNHALAWYRPKPDDFVPHTSNPLGSSLGKLSVVLIARIETTTNRLITSALGRSENVKNDRYVRDGRTALQRLVEQLQLAATKDESLLLLANIQRQYLELYARLEWLDKYLPRILGQERTHSVESRLMGAFAYLPDDLQRLFHAGIPVWYVREVTHLPATRVDLRVDPIDESANHQLPMRYTDKVLDLADADPPHRVVWSGGWTQGERYAAMARYIRTLYQYPVMSSLIGPTSSPAAASTSSITSPSISTSTSSSSQVLVDVLGKGPVPPRLKKQTGKTHAKASLGKAKTQIPRNKFLPLDHPLNPPAVPAWSSALSELSPFHDVRVPEKLGTYLPLPESLLSSNSEQTQAYLIATWIKLRPLFLWLLSNAGSNPLNLKGHQWRSILDLGHGLQYNKGSGTATSQKHKEMEKLLRQHLADRRHRVDLTLETIPTADVNWRDEALSQDRLPRPEVAREILWELYEINFRMELMTLDRTLLPQTEWGLRQNELSDCWLGLPFHVNLDNGSSGLGSPSFLQRLPYTRALYYVVQAWPGPKPDEISFPFPVQITDGSVTEAHFERQVAMVEDALTRFYVRTFFNTFARAPTIPHCLS